MENLEMLAISLASLIAALEVPLMLEEAQKVLGCQSINWLPVTPGLEAEDAALARALAIENQSLRDGLKSLLVLIQDIGIRYPEVA
jgi:hypothetical protein